MASQITDASATKYYLKRLLPSWMWRTLRAVWTLPRYLQNRSRIRAQQLDLSRHHERIVTHNYGGFDLQVYLSDAIAEQWYDTDWKELPEVTLLKKNKLRAGSRVFDLGAHHCVVALMFARIVGAEGFVLAVEAHPHNAKVGERNRELNDAPQLTVLPGAVAAEAGKVVINELLNASVDDGTSGLGQVEVPAYSIDDLTSRYGTPDVLFIDVEGFENEALKGATQTLKTRPDCFVEVHTNGGLEAYGGSVDSVVSYFPPGDYELFMASDDQHEFVPFAANDPLTTKRFFLVAISRSSIDAH